LLSSPSDLKSATAAVAGVCGAFLAGAFLTGAFLPFLTFFAFFPGVFEIGFVEIGMSFLLRALAALAR
jgi:hypothetical protein